ncbi:recombinase RecA [Nakamurella deserti]|uniref:recombinase RecA n=1 Tax=Nakamurella deserti TaxID=2164074 RepID=UPI000DBE43FF|nr:recombinase RecA [Nakamurella deserti]
MIENGTAVAPMVADASDRVFLVPDTGGAERGAGFDARVRRGSRRYVDVAAMLAGGLPEPPAPLLLARSDGHCLFYEGQVNVLFGDPESGKTLIALAALSELALGRRRSVFVDIDHNGPEAIVGRLLALGVDPAYLGDPGLFRYMEPEGRNDLLDIVAFLRTWEPAAAVVDSLGELLPLLGRKSNDPDDFTTAHSDVLKPIAVAGAAVIGIDHLAKNTDSRAAGPTGTAAKRRTVSGASIRVTVKEQFVPGRGGSAVLTVNKDRHGGLRRHCPLGSKEPPAGTFSVIPLPDGALGWDIAPPHHLDAEHLSGVAQPDLAALDRLDPPPRSVRDAAERLRWGNDRTTAALREWRRSRNTPRNEEQP